MERKKLEEKKKLKVKKASFFNCFSCTLTNDESDDQEESAEKSNTQLQPLRKSSSNMMAEKHEVSVTYQTTSSFIVVTPEAVLENTTALPNNNLLLSQAYSEKIQNDGKEETIDTEEVLADKENKDKVIKSILSKYLQMKREELLNDPEEVKAPPRRQHDCFRIESLSSSSETLVLDSDAEKTHQRPKAEFPTKSRSAPTTSTAHDSLADFCTRMSRYRQQDKSDSYPTSSSEENTSHKKKKLELIFNHSSEDLSSCFEDSSFSIQYAISCEGTPVTTGTLKADSVLHKTKDERSYEGVATYRKKGDLYVHPSARGEIGDVNGSSNSLKWKLIISHHDHQGFS